MGRILFATARPSWAGLVIALAVLVHATSLLAGETQRLPESEQVPLHSKVDVSRIATVDAARDGEPTRVKIQPRRRPDPEKLRQSKSSLPQAPVGPLVAPDTVQADAPGVITAFEGLANLPNNALAGFDVVPSDANLAAGPDHLFEMVNIVGRITNKAGGAPSTFTLRSFFQLDADADETDPRVIFDAASQRWFATMLQLSDTKHQSSVVLAVSATSNPSGMFCLFRLGNPAFEGFVADFPQLGIDDDKVIVTYNGFSFGESFLGSGYYAVNKADLVQSGSTGCEPQSVHIVRVPPNPSRYGIYPAQALSSTGRLYILTNGDGFTPSNRLTLFAVDGIPGVTTLTETTTVLPINLWRVPPDAVQQGSSVKLLTNDASLITAVWQRGSLWIGGNEACAPSGDSATRSCLRLIQIQTDLLSVRQDITFGAAGQYYYYPALSPDAAGNLFVVFNASSSSSFVGVLTTGRRATDPPNTLAAATVLRAGGGAQTDASSPRMGDFYGAALDPADPSKVWVTAEYIRTTAPRDWGTYVASLVFAPTPPLTLALALNGTTFHPGHSMIVDLTVGNPGGALVVDVYLGILLPPTAGAAVGCPLGDAIAFAAGSASNFVVRCFSDSAATFPRLAAGTTIPGGLPATLVPNFLVTVWPQAPAGVYVVFMAFTIPGAFVHGSIGPSDIIVFASAPLTFEP